MFKLRNVPWCECIYFWINFNTFRFQMPHIFRITLSSCLHRRAHYTSQAHLKRFFFDELWLVIFPFAFWKGHTRRLNHISLKLRNWLSPEITKLLDHGRSQLTFLHWHSKRREPHKNSYVAGWCRGVFSFPLCIFIPVSVLSPANTTIKLSPARRSLQNTMFSQWKWILRLARHLESWVIRRRLGRESKWEVIWANAVASRLSQVWKVLNGAYRVRLTLKNKFTMNKTETCFGFLRRGKM